MKIDIISLEKERFQWSQRTFPEATPEGSLAKAREELGEIEQDVKNNIKEPIEFADAIMCLFDAAARLGMDATVIMKAYSKKIEINKNRTWKKNPNNSYSHVKEKCAVQKIRAYINPLI